MRFIDEVVLTISGGHGGAGLVSFGKMAKSGPDGGNGGRGGDYYVEAKRDNTLLAQFASETEFAAPDGLQGGKSKRTGKDGTDSVLYLPVGTTLTEIETIHPNGITTSGETIELLEPGQRVLIATGGRGGRGNYEFRSSRRTTPKFAQSGLPGQKRIFHINLRLMADAGLIGLPNAGKSSLLNILTNAKAKVGAYAFTTLSPNLGVFDSYIIADIPGLIEGAHEGRGLGDVFLKHIDRVGVLIHCVSAEEADVVSAYETVRNEMTRYDKSLGKKREIILLTKVDLVDDKTRDALVKVLKQKNSNTFVVSLFDENLVEDTRATLMLLLQKALKK